MPRSVWPRSVWPRAVGALAAGSLIYLSTLYRGLTYAQRINGLPYVLFVFSGLMLVAGFVLTLRTPRLRYTIASLLLAGVFAGNWYVLMMDWRIDPTYHNLFPFEFVILAVLAAPVYLGAAFAQAVDARTRSESTQVGNNR